METYAHANTSVLPSGGLTTSGEVEYNAMINRLKGVDGVTRVDSSYTHVHVVFLEEVISRKEINAILEAVVTETALNSREVFPFVTRKGNIRPDELLAETADKKKFTVVLGTSSTPPKPAQREVLGKTARVYDLNAMPVGLNPEDGKQQPDVTREFNALFGGAVAKISGVFSWKVYNAQVKVMFFSDHTSVSDMDERVTAILQKIYSDTGVTIFPHLKVDSTPLEITDIFTGSLTSD